MSHDKVSVRELPNYVTSNAAIIQQFNQYRETDAVRRSHYFEGRYENMYLDLSKVPAMQTVMDRAQDFARQILNTTHQLKSGFWFNLMLPGQVTQLHSHDDDDECLSAVYYIDTPKDCGDLLLNIESEVIKITPQAGQFVFFPPDVPHEVTENKSNYERLSVGMNFGIKASSEI